jgi:hypothetical protein
MDDRVDSFMKPGNRFAATNPSGGVRLTAVPGTCPATTGEASSAHASRNEMGLGIVVSLRKAREVGAGVIEDTGTLPSDAIGRALHPVDAMGGPQSGHPCLCSWTKPRVARPHAGLTPGVGRGCGKRADRLEG